MYTLRILIVPTKKTISLKLDLETVVYDICRDLYKRIPQNQLSPVEEFGLFVPDSDPTRAYWLDNTKPVSYYPIMDKNLVLEFKSRLRRLIIRTMDDTKKTLEVDDSKSIAELIFPICNKMGISNHEEYSLIYEMDENERMKTLTLRRGKTQIRDFDKLEKMKQKLKTDDELNWLPHAKTLRQLGIDEKEELLLRRKYFFSDQNVDARDPIQLNLLYVQLKNAIIDGTHPVSIDEAIQLSGIQCQAELGNYSPEKCKSIHSNLKDFLPKEYIKTKGIEKRIIQQYEKLSGKIDKDVKMMYAQFCRSLKTYGITFFLVKEKVRAKNKLVPRLMGISKEYVMRVDEKTKEIIQNWPLTTVRRYAATASLFSLDFGDYSDENYVIQTTEGEKIAQLIGGYIDIIIKKQKAKDSLVTEVEEETAMIEENVAPSKANVISHNLAYGNARGYEQNPVSSMGQFANRATEYGVISKGQINSAQPIVVRSDNKIDQGHINAQPQKFQIRDLSQPKRALMIRIGDNLKILKAATEDLDKHIEVAKFGKDESSINYRKQTLDIAKSRVKGNLMFMTMATGNLLMMMKQEDESEEEEQDYSRIDAAITTIGYNTDKLMDNIRQVYEMSFNEEDENNNGQLIDAAKNLLTAFQDLLNASRPVQSESDASLSEESVHSDSHKFSDKLLLESVNKVGEASRILLHLVSVEQNQISDAEWESRDTLLTDAKQIANAVSGMVKIVKEASIALKESQGIESQTVLIQAAKHTGQATSMLISAAKVVACSIEQPLSQKQLHESAVQVIAHVEDVMILVQPLLSTHAALYQQLDESTSLVFDSIEKLLKNLTKNSLSAHQDPLVTKFLLASERLPAAIGNSLEMVTQAEILAEAGTELADCLNTAAMVHANPNNISQSTISLDADRQRRLMIAAQALTDAVGKLVHATKICVKESEQTIENQQNLMQAAHHMTSVAHMTAGEIIRQRLSKGLEFVGRQTALTADQLVLSSQEAAKTTRASNYQICMEAQEMTEVVLPEVILACSKIRENPINPNAQNNLLNACQKLIQNLEQLLKSSEALEPRVKDPSIQSALTTSMQNSQTSLADLKQCVQQADTVFKPTMVANIASLEDGQLQTLHSWMDSAEESIARGELYPLPGETIESVSAIIGSSSRLASKILDKLYNLPDMNNHLLDNNNAYSGLQPDFIKSAKELMDAMEKLLRGARGMAALKSKTSTNDNLYENQIDVIHCGNQLIRSGEDVIQGVKLASIGAVAQEELRKSIDKMKEDIDNLVYRIPAYQEIDSLIEKLQSSVKIFEDEPYKKLIKSDSKITKSHLQVQSEFTAAVAIFNQTLGDLINSNLSHSALISLSKQLYDSHSGMLASGKELIAEVPSNEKQLVNGLRAVSNNSTELLDHLKLVLVATGSPDVSLLKQSLLKAASMVSDSINDLLLACTSTLPLTQQICESSQRQLEALKTSLLAEPPSLPLNDLSYTQCMQDVNEMCQELVTQMKRIPITCKTGDSNDFCSAVQMLASLTTDMIKSATQANYKLGVIQSNISPSVAISLPDQLIDSLIQHSSIISNNCLSIASNDDSAIPYRDLAIDTKTRAGSVCQLVKECINNSKDPNHQNKLLEAGKRVAEATADLIKTINSCPRSDLRETDPWTIACNNVASMVEQLVQVAKSRPINATGIAYITEQGRQSQHAIHKASVDMIEGSSSLLRAAGALVRDSKSIPANQAFIINQKTFDNSLNRLNNIIKYSAPGQREFIEMEEELKQLLRNLDRVNMESYGLKNPKLNARSGDLLNSDIQRMQLSMKQLKNNLPPIENVLMDHSKLEYLGRTIMQANSYLAPIAESCNNLALSLAHSRDRGEIVELTKTVLEAFLALVQECESISNKSDFQEIDEYVSSLKIGVDDLTKFIDGIASCHGTVENMIASIQNSSARIDDKCAVDFDVATAHTSIVKNIKSISDSINEISVNKESTGGSRLQKKESIKKPKFNDNNEILIQNKNSDLNNPLKKLVQDYDSLVTGVIQFMGARISVDPDDNEKLKKCVIAVGQSSMDLIRYDQAEFVGQVRNRLGDLMFALQSSSRGTQCCIAAANEISQMVSDLDTAILFASSGTLSLTVDSAVENQIKPVSVAQIKEEIFKITKSLVSDLQKMVTSVDGRQENLAMATDNTVRRAHNLCNVVKNSAVSIGINPAMLGFSEMNDECTSAQTLLLNAVRDVAASLVDFFNCTKVNVSANSDKDKERDRGNLRASLETMVKSVDGLIKSVKSLEDSGCRGTRALEAALEAMRKEYRLLEAWNPDGEISYSNSDNSEYPQINVGSEITQPSSNRIYTVENLVLMTKPLVTASQKAITAVQTFRQEDILMAANIGRKAIQDFSHHIKVTIEMKLKEENSKPSRIFSEKVPITSDPDRRSDSVKDNSSKIVEHGRSAVKALIDMYENLNKSVSEGKKSESHKMQMTLASRRIAHSIHEVTESAAQLKNTDVINENEANNHGVIAEEKLLEAASQIDVAAKKLALLKPRRSIKKDSGETLTFDGEILTACGSIVNATSHLMKMASLSQQELISLGRLKVNENISDQHETQWTHGLISAARLVAAATENLCDSAKAVVQGKSGTDRLISASKQVAASTAHLLIACQVKSDADSKTNQRLQAAGTAVKRATEALVKEASEHRDVQDGSVPFSYEGSSKSMVNSMRNVIQAQADIVAKERELEMLRNKYQTIRQEQISTHPSLFSNGD